jgi:sugar lactone lactonase YvrE
MTDPETFEARLAAAVRRYSDDDPRHVDATALAGSIAIGAPAWRITPRALSVVALLVLALLLAVWALAGQRPSSPLVFAPGSIAYVQGGDLYVADPVGGDARVLVHGGAGNHSIGSPEFSPDRRYLGFVRGDGEVHVVTANGVETVVDRSASRVRFSWAPDGQRLAVMDYVYPSQPQVRVISPAGRLVSTLALPTGFVSGGWYWSASAPLPWSPDGRWIAVGGCWPGDSPDLCASINGIGSYVAVAVDGSGSHPLTTNQTSDGTQWLAWGPDSNIAVPRYSPPSVQILSLDGSVTKRIALPTGLRQPDGNRVAWSPDGSRLVESAWDDTTASGQLVVLSRDGTARSIAADRFPSVWDPRWSGDGGRIYFLVDSPTDDAAIQDTWTLWSIRTDGTDPVRVLPGRIWQDYDVARGVTSAPPMASPADVVAAPRDLGFADLALDADGRLYGSDCGHAIVVRFDADGPVIVAGTGSLGFSGDGGPATSAELYCPFGIAFDERGMFIVDHGNNRIRLVDPEGVITTFAGSGAAGIDQGAYAGDGGPAVNARLQEPVDVAIDGAGDVVFSDRDNHAVRRVDAAGIITTIAGTGTPGFSGDGGPARDAQLSGPSYLTADASGIVFVADESNHRVRRVDRDGRITTVAGNGDAGPAPSGGRAIDAALDDPQGLAVDAAGNLDLADSGAGDRILRVSPDGTIAPIAGTGQAGTSGNDGPAIAAQLSDPSAIVMSPDGVLYVASDGDPCIRAIGTDGIIRSIWCRQ